MKAKPNQTAQVIKALKDEGGFATLRRLNEVVDFSAWRTKTQEASVRRIVQQSEAIFKVRPDYQRVVGMYENLKQVNNLKW